MPRLLVSDSFDRTNVNPIGGLWTTLTNNSAIQIVGNQATPTALGSDCGARYAGTWANDQWVQGNFFHTGSQTTGGVGPALFARTASGANTCYRLVGNHGATTNWQLGKFVANSFTSLWIRLQAFTDGDLIRLEVQGTTLRAYINGVQIGADATDSGVTAGNPGCGYSSGTATSAAVDNFSAGDFSATPTRLVVQNQALVRASYW